MFCARFSNSVFLTVSRAVTTGFATMMTASLCRQKRLRKLQVAPAAPPHASARSHAATL